MLLVIPRSRFEAVILSNACNDKKWKPDAMETRRVSEGEAATESALADSEEHRCPIFFSLARQDCDFINALQKVANGNQKRERGRSGN